MTPEDHLRDVLRGGDDPVGGGSFEDVRARARRLDRRARLAKVGAAVVAVLALAGVAVPMLDANDDSGPRVTTEPGPDQVTVEEGPIGIWPFATAAAADDKTIDLPFNPTNAEATARAFLESNFAVRPEAVELVLIDGREDVASATELRAVLGRREVLLSLRRIGTSARWTVVEAQSDGLKLDTPTPGDRVTSPVEVRGRASAFEGTVLVSVVSTRQFDTELGSAVLTGEQGELRPFAGPVRFDADTSLRGAVIAVTRSAEDGSVEQLAAVPIRWGPVGAPESLPAMLAIADGQVAAVLTEDGEGDPDVQDVVLLDTSSGDVRHTLLHDFGTAEGGVLDLHVTSDRRTVLVALSTSACESEVRAYAEDGRSRRLGPGERVAVSPEGRWLAVWVREGCGERSFIEVRDLVHKTATRRFDTSGEVGDIAWVDEAALVYDVVGVELRRLSLEDGANTLVNTRWSQPVRNPERVTVVSKGSRIETLDGAELLVETDDEIVGHAVYGSEVLWITPGGVLTSTEGKVIRRDVAMVAS